MRETKDNINDIIDTLSKTYWNEHNRIMNEEYRSRIKQVDDMVKLGKVAEAMQYAMKANAALTTIR